MTGLERRPTLRAGDRPGRLSAWGPEAAVGAAALVVYCWRIGGASIWRDEAATLSMTRRTVGQLVEVTRTEELVHLAYYLVVHVVLSVWDSVVCARGISAVAMAVSAVLLVRVGRRLGSLAVGVTAGLLLAVSPLASLQAQNARSPSLVAALVLTSTLALIHARLADRGRAWIGYGLAVVAMTVVHLFAVFAVFGHALILWWFDRTHPVGPAMRRRLRRRELLALLVPMVLLVPFAVAAYAQRAQVDWITRPGPGDLARFYANLSGGRFGLLLIAGCLAAAAVVLVRRRTVPAGPEGDLLVVGLAMAVPPLLLWTVSQAKPVWDQHYVIFALPGWLLAVAAVPFLLREQVAVVGDRPLGRGRSRSRRSGVRTGSSAFGPARLAAGLLVLALAAVAVPTQLTNRSAAGHGENLDGVAAFVAGHKQPGDGIIFGRRSLRTLLAAEPERFTGLRDVTLASSPIASGTLLGVEVAPEAVPAAVATVERMWMIRLSEGTDSVSAADRAKPQALASAGFREVSSASFSGVEVVLYRRPGA